MSAAPVRPPEYEYVVVGSGAGGGTLAARLAESGHKVLLLEAGGDPLQAAGTRLPEDYQVPAFHAFASENEAMRWDFFVRHYGNDIRQRRDPKFTTARDGVLYPRAGTLGGCTAHNAMIMVYPHNTDWDGIADLTGDSSWRAVNMRKYFERLEDCRHRPPYRWLYEWLGVNPSRHGFGGWLATERPRTPKEALRDRAMMDVVERSGLQALLWHGTETQSELPHAHGHFRETKKKHYSHHRSLSRTADFSLSTLSLQNNSPHSCDVLPFL
jgi:choline dehydrogenase-like flavoprotein